jgi:hypothetical protein
MLDTTGATGSMWMVGVPVGNVSATLTPTVGEAITTSLPVMDQAITFGSVTFPEDTTPTS